VVVTGTVVVSPGMVVVVSPGIVVVVVVEVVVGLGVGFIGRAGSATCTSTTDSNLTTVPAAGFWPTALVHDPLKAPGPVVSKKRPASCIAL
jgi:hypothetical protein